MFCRFCGAVMDESLSICPKCGKYATGSIKDSSSGQRKNADFSGGSFDAEMNQNTSNPGQTNAGGGSFGDGMNQNASNPGQTNAGYPGGSFGDGMNQNASNSGQPNAGYSGGSFGDGMNQNTSNPGQPNAGYQGNPYGNFYGSNRAFNQRTWKDVMAENCIVTKDGKRLGIGWLKFFFYFGIYVLLVIFVLNAFFYFSGSLKRSEMVIDVGYGILNVLLIVGLFVFISGFVKLKKFSVGLLTLLDAINLLFVTSFYFYTINSEISAPVYCHIFNALSILILFPSSQSLFNRKDAFIN